METTLSFRTNSETPSSAEVPTSHAQSFSPARKVVWVNKVPIGGEHFVVMAGPCSIESPEQLRATALNVKKGGASLLRGGIWKLRTRAQSFQGLGTQAFQFIGEILEELQMGLISEVSDARQIELLDQNVVMYQVGARNMYNYSLLKELGQTRKPVILKRAFSATVDEWIQAAGYLQQGGNENIVLCERGIRTFETSSRYTFDLNGVLLARERCPYPVVVDPSHAIGLREHVPALCYAAAAAGADGIMVEVHPDPDKALSDGRQSLSFQDFEIMARKLEAVLTAVDRPLWRLK